MPGSTTNACFFFTPSQGPRRLVRGVNDGDGQEATRSDPRAFVASRTRGGKEGKLARDEPLDTGLTQANLERMLRPILQDLHTMVYYRSNKKSVRRTENPWDPVNASRWIGRSLYVEHIPLEPTLEDARSALRLHQPGQSILALDCNFQHPSPKDVSVLHLGECPSRGCNAQNRNKLHGCDR